MTKETKHQYYQNTCPTCGQPVYWEKIDKENKRLVCVNNHHFVSLKLPHQPEQLVDSDLIYKPDDQTKCS